MMEDLSHYNPEGSELRVLQLKMLDILTTVTNICDKHNLPYWLSDGTLLGAVRHEGFIPWDDDIDIGLMRKDYKKLLKILADELPENLYLQTPKEKSYRLLFSKVRDKNSTIYSEEEDMARYKYKGVFVDIFPHEFSYPWLKKIVDFFYGRGFRRYKRGRAFQSFKYFYEFCVSIFLLPIGYVLKWLGRAFCAIKKTKHILYGYGIGINTSYHSNYMFPLRRITFEDREFSCPNSTDLYLKSRYGDYMTIPEKEDRLIHYTKVTYH